MEIEGKKAVIVGGASGFGRATAESLAKRGASVAVLDRPQSKGQARWPTPSAARSTRWTSPTS